MGVFCDRLKLGYTAALNCGTGLNKGRYCKKELLFLLVLLISFIEISFEEIHFKKHILKTNNNEKRGHSLRTCEQSGPATPSEIGKH